MPLNPNNFAKELDRAMTDAGLSAEQKERVADDLGSAIYLNLFQKLYEKVPEEDKDSFFKDAPESPEMVLRYFERWFSKNEIRQNFKESVREIVEQFLGKIN